jgi:hypothetical protein
MFTVLEWNDTHSVYNHEAETLTIVSDEGRFETSMSIDKYWRVLCKTYTTIKKRGASYKVQQYG